MMGNASASFHDMNTTVNSNISAYYAELGSFIGTIIYPIIYSMGFLGNAFALITFSSRNMRQISSSIFLLVLSISDSLALITSWWFFLSDAFSIYLQNYSALACRFRTFFAYVFMDLSSWCIAGLAIDRYLRVKLPFASKTICTSRNASITILILFVFLCGLNAHYFSPAIGQERDENRSMAHCLENRDEYPRYYFFHKIIWPKIDMAAFCFLPACIMIFCNASLIYLRGKQLVHLKRLGINGVQTNLLRNSDQQTAQQVQPINKVLFVHRKAMEKQMSLMMAACVIVFLITTVPVTVYLILLEEVIMKNSYFALNNAVFTFIFRILRAIMYIRFASSFYLYCLTSHLFRIEFLRIITPRKLVLRTINEQIAMSIFINKFSE